MSLTSIMESGFSRKIMRAIPFPVDVFQDDNCLACPRSSDYSLIGIAFDYLLRLEILRANPRAKEEKLVGHLSIEHFQEFGIELNENDRERILYKTENDYMEARKEYIKSGILTDELIENIIKFAMLDYIYRAKSLLYLPNVEPVSKANIEDMKALHSLIPDYFKIPHRSVRLNPTFGETSMLVGGADVDLIIDGNLIDIKTVKRMQVTETIWSQLVGYLMLAEEARKHMNFPKIKKFGIYFSRFGKLWLIDSRYVYENPRYESTKKKLFKLWEDVKNGKIEKLFS
ncbi:MAG: hypothetical protein QW292_09470 [Candidatus Parvarchaeota archaeon]